MLDTILFGFKILLLILLYLFIFRVARGAARDLSETAQAVSPTPRGASLRPLASMGFEQPSVPAASTLDGPQPPAVEREMRRAGRESERTSEGGLDMMAHVRPRLIVERSPVLDEGTEVELHGWLTIGRSPASNLPLNDGFVSTTHARIMPRGQYFFVEDLGSTNGTYVNEKRVTEAQLRPEARVRIGETVLRYEE